MTTAMAAGDGDHMSTAAAFIPLYDHNNDIATDVDRMGQKMLQEWKRIGGHDTRAGGTTYRFPIEFMTDVMNGFAHNFPDNLAVLKPPPREGAR